MADSDKRNPWRYSRRSGHDPAKMIRFRKKSGTLPKEEVQRILKITANELDDLEEETHELIARLQLLAVNLY